jgi:ketosteroid isomerase-like protein
MADLTPIIETMENRWMRAWVGRDMKELKALTARDFILLMGSKPAVILDARSWLEAASSRWLCSSYRFGDVYVRRVGSVALFASQLELKATMDGHDWSGRYWVSDLWRKRRIGGWRMAERVISRPEDDKQVPGAIRSLQLWR